MTYYLYLVPKLSMSGATPLLHLYVIMVPTHRTTLHVDLAYCLHSSIHRHLMTLTDVQQGPQTATAFLLPVGSFVALCVACRLLHWRDQTSSSCQLFSRQYKCVTTARLTAEHKAMSSLLAMPLTESTNEPQKRFCQQQFQVTPK